MPHAASRAAVPTALPSAAPATTARLGLLANPDFRRLWLVGVVVFAVRWLEMIVVGVFVYQHTGSAFTVALMTMLRMLPMALFGAVIGAVAERLDRRSALIGVVLAMLTTSLCLAALAHAGSLEVWHLAVASFCNGVAWAADNPVRRVMIGDVVGPERMGSAMSVDVGANNASRMLGPTIGGVLLAAVRHLRRADGQRAVLRGGAGRRAAGPAPQRAPPAAAVGGVLARMIEGLVLVRHDPKLSATLIVTVIYNVFGWPFTAMIPVIGQDNLLLGAERHRHAREHGRHRRVLRRDRDRDLCEAGALRRGSMSAASYSYLVLQIVFALVPNVPLAGAALLFGGVSNAAFSVMQATLIYLAAPPEMRSRMYGVLSVCIGTGPIGFLCLGLLADAIGAALATAMTGALGLLVLAATWKWWRRLGMA